ncbi:MAG TPA: glycosyltransferase family 2 protein [Planctomycetaceae bacterium]|nr:glycosyltransferase family 2 protein [Planctomycetaceae bacterium]
MSAAPRVTIMIATHNRVDELLKTLESCRVLSGPPPEILVVDDTSTDGTYETVRTRFPKVNIVRNEVNKGSIASRNDILRRARGDYIVGLDDDSRFVDADACERIVARMDREPDLGIISCQAIGPEFPQTLQPGGRASGEWHTSSFAFCAVVIRRSMLQQTGLLPEMFFHSYEEPDLALRAWDAGYRVVQWNEIVVYHEFSGKNRNEQRTHRRHARNEACSVVMRYPWPWVVPGVLGKLLGQVRYAARQGWLMGEPRVWGEFLWRLPRSLQQREAVSARAIKIAVGLNRRTCVDPQEAWQLGSLPLRQALRRAPKAALAQERRER